jgi:hypothetical protein
MIKKLLLLSTLLGIIALYHAGAQPPGSSKGRDFWLTFMPNVHRGVGAPPGTDGDAERRTDSLYIFVAAETATRGTITYRDINGRQYIRNFSINDPSQIYTFSLMWDGFELIGVNNSNTLLPSGGQSEKVAPQSFHVETDNDVTVYALTQAWTTSDAFLVLPRAALGLDYFIMSYPSDVVIDDRNNQLSAASTPSQFAIVAVEDNTQITIEPKAPLRQSGLNPPVITLQKGQVYLAQALMSTLSRRNDLTGTSISANKPVAVFAGHQRARIPTEASAELNSRDCLVEQMVSTANFGKSAFLTPYPLPGDASPIGWDVFRVLAALDSTEIFVDSQRVAILNQGQYYTGVLNRAAAVTSSKPFMVAQYKKTSSTQNTGLANSDPFMMIIPPFEQFLASYRFISAQAIQLNGDRFSSLTKVYNYQYVNVVVPEKALNTVVLDGSLVSASSFQRISNTSFFYATLPISDGVHSIRADEPIGIYVYGYGPANSYGYVGGMSFSLFDYKAPVFSSARECNRVYGTVYDTTISDSRLRTVISIPDSQINVSVKIDPFTLYADSVNFDIRLTDPYKDGSVIIAAEDSAGYRSRRHFDLPGFTVKADLPDSLPIIAFDGPISRQYCFPFTIINQGRFPQTLQSVLLSQGIPEYKIEPPISLPLLLQPGEKKTLQICFRTPVIGLFREELIIGDSCNKRTIARFEINAIRDTVPPKIVINKDSCGLPAVVNVADELITDSGLEFIKIVDSLTWNCAVEITKLGQSATISIKSIDPFDDAFYYIIIRDSAGNTRIISDTVPGLTISVNTIEGMAATIVRYDTLQLGRTHCDSLILKNFGRFTITLPTVFTSGNIAFSVPVSQFPIFLPPGSAQKIAICYHPIQAITEQDTIDRDTLFLRYSCYEKGLPLIGYGREITSFSQGQCNVRVKSDIIGLPGLIGLPRPHPVDGSSHISFAITNAGTVRLQLRPVLGGNAVPLFNAALQSGIYEAGFEVQDVQNGLYVLEMNSADGTFVQPIIIQR